MEFAGLDIGSRSIELVVVDCERIICYDALPTTHDPLRQCKRLLDGKQYSAIRTTGYGRKLAACELACESISEISAYARGARSLDSSTRSIIDIGGQDTKVITLTDDGKVARFEMNDRCAAGTGRFLEVMAVSFQMPVEELGSFALLGKPGISISSMCTVFAESEVTSLLARGVKAEDVAYAIHESVFTRTMAMWRRTSPGIPVMFAGGVAHNQCMAALLKAGIEGEVLIPANPEFVGALGAALLAREAALGEV
jgi:(R)-2-hydroxyacyl-CoA dehydratese activating ATPase